MTQIKLLANAGDWVAGSVVMVDEHQADRLIRTGYAVKAPQNIEAPRLRGAKRMKERTH